MIELRDIKGFEGIYQISSDGRLWSVSRRVVRNGRQMRVGGRWVRPSEVSGYKRYSLHSGSKRISRMAHSLVAEAFIGPLPMGFTIDHIDRNRSNNIYSNLRFASRTENAGNANKRSDSALPYRGIHKVNGGRYWAARIQHKGIRKNIGCYRTPEEAARAYDAKALELFGEFSNLNFQ